MFNIAFHKVRGGRINGHNKIEFKENLLKVN